MYIYIAINNVNGKIYIGQTKWTVEYRKNKHFQEARSEKRRLKNLVYFHNAILKYGEDAFEFYEIDSADTEEELDQKEIYWIRELDATNKEIGYNLDSGGSRCVRHPSTIEKLRISTQHLHDTRPEYRATSIEGLRLGTKRWQEICKNRRIEFTCPVCQNTYLLAPYEVKKRTYCSRECSLVDRKNENIKNLKIANRINEERKNLQNAAISKTIYNWVCRNQELVLNCPFNKVSSTLKDLNDVIYEKHGVKDWRTIGESVGCKYKKDLLLHLKEYLSENICCSSPN